MKAVPISMSLEVPAPSVVLHCYVVDQQTNPSAVATNRTQIREREAAITAREAAIAARETKATDAELEAKADALDVARKLLDQKLSAWQKLVDMATHFNELCLTVRRFALATLATLLAAAGVAYRFAGHISLDDPDLAIWIVRGAVLLLLTPVALAFVVRGRPSVPADGTRQSFFKRRLVALSRFIPALTRFIPASAPAQPSVPADGTRPSSFKRRLFAFTLLILCSALATWKLFSQPIQAVHIASLFIGVAAVTWVLCYLMDRFWYHELLRGVLAECASLERTLGDIGGLAVTTQIRTYSHASLNLSAGAKLTVFYVTIYVILTSTLVAMLLAAPNSVATPREQQMSISAFEVYQLAPIPAFPQGSSELTEPARVAVCAARAALVAMRVSSAFVVGAHDRTELRSELRQSITSNAALARARAEQVALALRGSVSCDAPPIANAIALDSPPLNVGSRGSAKDLANDRVALVFALRIATTVSSSSPLLETR